VGFDPALGITEGDEMNQAHQRRLGELMDRIAIDSGACVMVTTHAARSMLHADELGSHSSRGGGAITDAVRGEYACGR
jgi:RecA-family ATPase